MPLTAQAAIDLLVSNPSAYTSEAALLNLASQVSVDAPGSVTLLYSGQTGGMYNSDIARAMAATETKRVSIALLSKQPCHVAHVLN